VSLESVACSYAELQAFFDTGAKRKMLGDARYFKVETQAVNRTFFARPGAEANSSHSE
jgi:hypothetical protein